MPKDIHDGLDWLREIGTFLGVQTSVCSGIFDSAMSKLRFDAKTPLHS